MQEQLIVKRREHKLLLFLTKELSLCLDYPEFIHQKIISENELRNYLKKHNRALKKIEIDRHLKAIDMLIMKTKHSPISIFTLMPFD